MPTKPDRSAGASRTPTHRTPPRPDRIRRITGGFAFLPNEFLHQGFFASLSDTERSLYFFLVDRGTAVGGRRAPGRRRAGGASDRAGARLPFDHPEDHSGSAPHWSDPDRDESFR
jgi:hypothetical protein